VGHGSVSRSAAGDPRHDAHPGAGRLNATWLRRSPGVQASGPAGPRLRRAAGGGSIPPGCASPRLKRFAVCIVAAETDLRARPAPTRHARKRRT
jgi:hypothetical protein